MVKNQLLRIPALKDNYIWGLVSTESRSLYVVDPGDAAPVLAVINANNLYLKGILLTHYHLDHVGGVDDLLQFDPSIAVFGPKNTHPAVQRVVEEGDKLELPGLDFSFYVLEIPGHTASAVAYYGNRMLFSGDTLFSLGCGRVFDGTVAELEASLGRIAELPDDTTLYCAHEYTESNLRFAQSLPGMQLDMTRERILAMRCAGLATVPSVLLFEKKQNPFLLALNRSFQAAWIRANNNQLLGKDSVFSVIRTLKNDF